MPTQKKKPARKRTSLILAASEGDSNMLYATGFFVPDPFIFFEHLGRTHVVMSDLEIDRAKKEANVDSVLSLSDYWRRLKRQGKATGTGDVLELIFKERGIRTLEVPSNFPVLFADDLRSRRFTVAVKKDPFFDEREKKSPMEVKKIQDSIRVAEIGLEAGIKVLKRARIGKDRYLYLNGRRLTSEAVKTIVNTSIMALGWVPSHTIIAGGDQCCDPHNEGHGPLRAHTSIIFDIFPRSQKTGFFGDLSRTVVRGRATERLKEVYEAVRLGQEFAFKLIRDGIQGSAVHEMILDLFRQRGFSTGKINGRMQGFFHGTGHGLGLDIHEPPRIGVSNSTLRSGHVVTVEPGLYYVGVGGVRLEDAVVVTPNGNRNLTRYHKVLEI
ncbi:MAG: Xaa-Pro peptidase family protein [Candidatus Binatia bacterium]